MASRVDDLQFALEKIAKYAQDNHFGASDRRRTLGSIKTVCELALTGQLGTVFHGPSQRQPNE